MSKKNGLIFIGILLLIVISISFFNLKSTNNDKKQIAKVVNIEEVLRTESYTYLPKEAKDYIREVYNETGVILHTEKNKEENEEYLNPSYIEYLKRKEDAAVIPSSTVVDYVPIAAPNQETSPTSYDLRNVDGKNYITPWKNQGSEGLCWDYATNATLESHLLKINNKEYDETATIFSEQQIDYATATNGTEIENHIYKNIRELSSGGNFEEAEKILIDGLGTVPNSWDQAHQEQIRNKSIINLDDIYNFDNSLYELNSTFHFPTIDFQTASDDTKSSYIEAIKTNIINYGGAWVSTDIYAGNYNFYNGNKIKVINAKNGSLPFMNGYHAMEIIGWDDSIEYITCNKSFNGNAPSDCNNDYRTGQGVWILKNSWGETDQPIMYLAYESYGTDIFFITNLSERTWDNFYATEKAVKNDTTVTFSIPSSSFIGNEKIDKIKAELPQNNIVTISISSDGTTFTNLGTITTTYQGYYYLDVSSSNKTLTNNTIIKVTANNASNVNGLRIYTDNESTTKDLYTEDYIFNGMLNSNSTFNLPIFTQTKNISNGTPLTVKIKDSNNNYIDTNAYSFSPNKVYANVNYANLAINKDNFSKGKYTIEVYYDETNYKSSELNLKENPIATEGDGTSSNPWKIYHNWQFNLIRDYPEDSFELMADLDFENDTQDTNGAYYNDGYGFEAIYKFKGYLNGNNHKIKNLYSKAEINTNNNTNKRYPGIFNYVDYYKCSLSKCGIENIQVVNPNIIGSYTTGGLINELRVDDEDYGDVQDKNIVINNLSVIGGSVKSLNQPTYNIGGVIGSIGYVGLPSKTFTINNLYNSASVTGNSNINKVFNENIGGVVGVINTESTDGGKLILNNLMNIGKLNHSTYYKSMSGIANFDYVYYNDIEINNAISLNNNNYVIGIGEDAVSSCEEFKLDINNIYTDNENAIDSKLSSFLSSSNNILENQTTIDIANADYSDWENFDTNWTQYNEDGVKRIPILNNIPMEYFEIDNTATLEVGESLDLLTLVTNDKYNDELSFVKSCSFNSEVCNNNTDETIISLSNTTITALASGTTYIIVENTHDGYLGTIEITISGKKKITFDSNGGIGTMEDQLFSDNTEIKLSPNTFTKEHYNFKKWNTLANGEGDSYTDEQTVSFDDDITLYAIWEGEEHSITFNANGGNGTMSNQTFKYNEEFELNANAFNYPSHRFAHWNTKEDDKGTSYENGQKVTLTEDTTLYAIWESNTHTITFYANGGEGEMAPQVFDENETKKISPNTFTKENHHFSNWNTEPDGSGTPYQDEQSISLTKDITLYAQYAKNRYYIYFSLDGGTGPDDYKVDSGDTITRPAEDPEREGYIFVDWYSDEDKTILFDFSKPITETVILYAKWRKPILTWNINDGTTLEGFEATKEYLVGSILTLQEPGTYKIAAPENYEFDAYEINGARYLLNQEYTINDNVTIKCLWKEITPDDPEELYNVTLKKITTTEETVPYDTNITNYVNSKKELMDNTILEFKTGKERVTVANYDNLFTTSKYAIFDSFELVDTVTNTEANTITYKYDVNYKEVTINIEKLKKAIYKLNKVEDKEEELSSDTDLVSYIAKKKDEFIKKVSDMDIDDLFIANTNTNTYQYAEFISTEKVNASEENNIVTTKYNHNYNLVKIIIKQEYVLTEEDNTITFLSDAGNDYKLELVDLLKSTTEEIKQKVEKLKKDRKGDTLLGAYKIEVKNNKESLHKGPFKLKLKLNDDMKKYKKFYMIYISDNNKEEEPIEFTRDGDYVEGTLNHLSEYILVGKLEEEVKQEEHEEQEVPKETKEEIHNPTTIDKISFYIITLIVIIISVIIIRQRMKHNKYKIG